MNVKRVLAMILTALLVVVGVNLATTQTANAATKNSYGLTTQKPIKYNKDKGEIYILTTVNGTYFNQPTRHVIVNEDGSNGDKSLLKTKATPDQFYRDLKKIGAKPGNNLTKKSDKGTKIKGSKLNVSFVINHKKVAVNKAVQVNGKDTGNLKFRFGGNKAMADKMNTGCVLCFDSCPVGIASGAKYGFSYGEHFTGKSNVLPKDGTNMVTVVKLVKSTD